MNVKTFQTLSVRVCIVEVIELGQDADWELRYPEFHFKDVLWPDDIQVTLDDLRSRLDELYNRVCGWVEWIEYAASVGENWIGGWKRAYDASYERGNWRRTYIDPSWDGSVSIAEHLGPLN